MSKKTALVFAALVTFWACCVSSLMAAPEESPEEVVSPQYDSDTALADSLALQGRNLYQQGDLQGATDDFCRALTLDTRNRLAREQLRIINQRGSLDAVRKTRLLALEDVLTFNANLRDRIRYFRKQSTSLKRKLLTDGYAPSALEQPVVREQEIASNVADVRETADPLTAASALMSLEKKRLMKELAYVQGRYAWLKNVRVQGAGHADNVETQTQYSIIRPTGDQSQGGKIAVAAMPVVSGPISADVEKPVNLGTWRPQDHVAVSSAELQQLRQEFKNLQAYVQEKDLKLERLTKQVVDLSLKLTENKTALDEKIELLSKKDQEYGDLESRFELGQKIIQEKSVQVQSLQDSLAGLQTEVAQNTKETKGLLNAQAQEREQFEGILAIYQEKLQAMSQQVRAGEADRAALQEDLTAIRTQLFAKETALDKTREKLTALEKQLTQVQRRLKKEGKRLPRRATPDAPDVSGDMSRIKEDLKDVHAYVSYQMNHL